MVSMIPTARVAMPSPTRYAHAVRRIIAARLFSVLLFCVVVLCLEEKAWAYGDPGSGTLVWQLLGAFTIGLMFYVRRALAWIRAVVGKKNTERDRSLAREAVLSSRPRRNRCGNRGPHLAFGARVGP